MPSATSSSAVQRAGAWRDGNLMLVHEGATLPPHCPICNAPVDEPPVQVRSFRLTRGGIIAESIADAWDEVRGATYTGPVTARFYFCKRHRVRQRNMIIACVILIALGGAATETCWIIDPKNGLSGAFFIPMTFALGGLGVLVILLRGANVWFHAKRFANRWVWLKGACPEFLEQLPDVSKAPARQPASQSRST